MQREKVDLERIIAEFRPIVSFRVRKSLGSGNPDWEDIVNEVIAQVVEKIQNNEFRGDSSIGTFIYTITSRRIVDYIRQKTKILRHSPEPASIPDPADQLEMKERADQMARLIESLKPKYKDILYLYYYKDLTREEVARRLGISPNKVSERLHYAQKLLQKKIKK